MPRGIIAKTTGAILTIEIAYSTVLFLLEKARPPSSSSWKPVRTARLSPPQTPRQPLTPNPQLSRPWLMSPGPVLRLLLQLKSCPMHPIIPRPSQKPLHRSRLCRGLSWFLTPEARQHHPRLRGRGPSLKTNDVCACQSSGALKFFPGQAQAKTVSGRPASRGYQQDDANSKRVSDADCKRREYVLGLTSGSSDSEPCVDLLTCTSASSTTRTPAALAAPAKTWAWFKRSTTSLSPLPTDGMPEFRIGKPWHAVQRAMARHEPQGHQQVGVRRDP